MAMIRVFCFRNGLHHGEWQEELCIQDDILNPHSMIKPIPRPRQGWCHHSASAASGGERGPDFWMHGPCGCGRQARVLQAKQVGTFLSRVPKRGVVVNTRGNRGIWESHLITLEARCIYNDEQKKGISFFRTLGKRLHWQFTETISTVRC